MYPPLVNHCRLLLGLSSPLYPRAPIRLFGIHHPSCSQLPCRSCQRKSSRGYRYSCMDLVELYSVPMRPPSAAILLLQKACTYSWLQIDQYCTGNISCVVRLVEKNVLPISTFRGKVLQVSILTDSMLLTKLLPKLAPNWPSSASDFDGGLSS